MAENSEQMYQIPMSDGAAQIMRTADRKSQQEAFDKNLSKLEQRAADYMEKYGEDDYRTVMITSFLDVSLCMKETIVTITDMKDAIRCITDATLCIDEVYREIDEAFGETLVKQYGLLYRLKQQRKVKKAIRNTFNRVSSLSAMIVGGHKMSLSIVKAMRKMGLKIQKSVVKTNEQQERSKRRAKKSGMTLPESQGKKRVEEIIRERHAEQKPDDPAPSAPPAAGKSGSEPDDLSDII